MSWRRLEDVFRLQKTSSRRLQDVLIKTNIFILVIRFQKTSSRRLGQDQYIRLGHTSSRRLQDVLKKSSRHLQDVLQKFFENLQNVFKTSLQKYLQDVFKTYHQIKMFFLTSLWDVPNTFVRRTANTVIYRKICLGHTFEKFMVSVQNLIKTSQVLVFYFTTPFSGCLQRRI